MTEAKSHSACDPLVICVRQSYKLAFLAAARIIRAMQTKDAFVLALTIALMLLIMKPICSFIGHYVYIFWLFFLVCVRLTAGILLISPILWIVFNSLFSKNETKRFSPNDSRTGEYIRVISFSYMIFYFTFDCPVFFQPNNWWQRGNWEPAMLL